MPLADNALISIDEARLYCKLNSSDKPTDEWFELAVNGVSEQIEKYTGRVYQPYDSTATVREFTHTGGKHLEIDDCTDIELIRVTATPTETDSWISLAASNWIAQPAQDEVKTTIRFLESELLPAANQGWAGLGMHVQRDDSSWPAKDKAVANQLTVVEVTARYGHPSVPGNVKLAACMWISYLLNRDQAMFSPELAEAVISEGAMPKPVEGILNQERNSQGGVTAV